MLRRQPELSRYLPNNYRPIPAGTHPPIRTGQGSYSSRNPTLLITNTTFGTESRLRTSDPTVSIRRTIRPIAANYRPTVPLPPRAPSPPPGLEPQPVMRRRPHHRRPPHMRDVPMVPVPRRPYGRVPIRRP
ncbi:unnamed protein product [Rotaria magnacalcarata]|uniref:Uncharacterized protein n=2 Tax=Rotaria magnacalcarata TaxID=392030 RepID=A0A816QCE2_9BILA|nr:unnamed protein product [Rotaria magnacalcarata]CAF2134432.1 unnamed protein product [Rotaria magnacalcarata]CAF3851979.1 unnamed protein product [Rotaria magnacalcarata]CAF3872656.1 unnamed protein product [Rotaria magnacalcarata]